MAINLWKLQKPTSYNPLPTGLNNTISVNRGLYIASFKAKSPTNSPLAVTGNNLVLTSEFQSFKVEVNAVDVVRFYDTNVKGDIIITDIQLVQKPLPKLTINGISDNVADWEVKPSLNVLGMKYDGREFIPVLPNTTYTLSGSNGYKFGIDELNNSKTFVKWWDYLSTRTFTTSNTTYFLRCFIKRNDEVNVNINEITQIKPMLNLGSTPAPYSKKTGEKMVLSTVKGRNLFDGMLESGAYDWNSGNKIAFASEVRSVNLIPVKENTSYTFSCNGYSGNFVIHCFNSAKQSLGGVNSTLNTVLTKSGTAYIGFRIVSTDITARVMLNEGATPLPYEPYAVQVNIKPKKYVPKKNLFDGLLELGSYDNATGVKSVSTVNVRSTNKFSVKPSTNLYLWNDKGYQFNFMFYGINGNFIGGNGAVESGNIITTPSNAYFMVFRTSGGRLENDVNVKIMIHEGTTATPYEPYQLVLPRAKTGLAFNGVSDLIEFPHYDVTSRVEVEVDVNITAYPSVIASKYDRNLSNQKSWLISCGSDGKIQFITSHNGGGDNVLSVSEITPLNTRLKLKCVYDGASQLIYINGVEKARLNHSLGIFQGTEKVYLGARRVGDKLLNGIVYNFKISSANGVVSQYDFENPSNIVGDKVLASVVGNVGKNLFDGRIELGSYNSVDGSKIANTNAIRSIDKIPVTPNQTYIFSDDKSYVYAVYFYTSSGTFISFVASNTFTTPSNAYFITFRTSTVNVQNDMSVLIQLEQGTVPTAYTPFSLSPVNTKPNLIPSFEDARWSLHANADVLGKDVLRLEATAGDQQSRISFPVTPGKTYLLNVGTLGSNWRVTFRRYDVNNAYITYNYITTFPFIYTVPSDVYFIDISLNCSASGIVDFIKPQLYELTGKEGTVVGAPSKQRKQPRRRLYAKR